MKEVEERLFSMRESEYALFTAKLTPSVSSEKFIGVRVPKLRAFAREFSRSEACSAFLAEKPHFYYEENLLHSILLGNGKDYGETLRNVEEFLPYVDNWAVCDTLRPKIFGKNREKLLPKVKEWIRSEKTYTCRFGLDMLMTYYLGENFKPEYNVLAASVKSEEYYVNMMAAWYFATALAKNWDETVPYIEKKVLPAWTHGKTIQKACESYRISDEKKAYLRTLK